MAKHEHVYGPVVAVKDGKTVKYQACRICGAKGDDGSAGVREPRRRSNQLALLLLDVGSNATGQ